MKGISFRVECGAMIREGAHEAGILLLVGLNEISGRPTEVRYETEISIRVYSRLVNEMK